jgi:chemotaxis protein MotB
MRRVSDGMRHLHIPILIALCLLTALGCVGTDTHTKTVTELTAAKEVAAQQAADLEALKKRSDAQAQQLKQQLTALQQNLEQESNQRKAVEASIAQLQGEFQQAEQRAESLARERDALRSRSEDLQAKLDTLDKEKVQLNTELGDVRGQIKDLEQKLASGNASAQDQISSLQQRAHQLESDAARLGKEREQLRQEQSQLAATLEHERQRLKLEEAEKARLTQEQDRLREAQSQLAASLEQERQRLKLEEAEKARLEQERAAKEEEIKRLTRTQQELSRSLQDEIAKGTITIQQVRDRLTINMVDRVLFDSGQAQIKPAGIKVLKQVGDVLKTVTDKQIRIEGHTDNVPISIKLQDRFKTNWELSTARATTVVRYLIDQGGVDRQYLSAVGYAETHPVASNETDEGRSANRRIEIILYPKDLQQVTSTLTNGAVAP